MLEMFNCFVHPHLEYADPVGNPLHIGEIPKIEKIQKFALPMCTKMWGWSYQGLLITSGNPSPDNLESLCDIA